MSKITLTDVKGGFNLTAIQSNFDALETELQGKVLYRNNPVGEPNTMETDMDMNNKRILNLPEPISDNEPLRKRDAGSLSSLIASAAGYASTASIKAAEATASASSASGSAASATASANAASASAIAAAASAVTADASADAAAASAIAAEDSSRLAVGTTTTGAPGSSVIVTITGSPGTQDLNLTIPRGDVGATGPAGPAGADGADGAGMTPQAIGFTVTGGTTPKTLTVALDANVAGTNTGDNAVNSLYSGLVTNATHTGDATGSSALTVVAINGTNMAGLATGILKNTTGTGVPSIAVAGTDYQTAQSVTGMVKSSGTTRSAATAGTDYTSPSSTETMTNKRITPRVGSTTSSATPTINTDTYDIYKLTAQTVDITSFTTNLSGTPTDNQCLIIEITGTAARAITWGASFEASTVALPTTTVTTAMLAVAFIWNTATSKWRCVAAV